VTTTSQFIIALGVIFVLIWVAFGFALTFADWKQYEEVEEEEPAAHSDQPAEHLDDQSVTSRAPHDEAEAKRRKRQKAYRESPARLINITAGLNVLSAIAAVAGFGALYMLYGTLVETKNAVTVANNQAAAAATEAAAAMRSAEAAEKANRNNLAEFRLSERPWVDITEVRAKGPLVFDSAKSAHIDVEVTTVNGGRSAAVNEGSELDLVMSVGNVAADRESGRTCDPAFAHMFVQADAVVLPNVPFLSEWQLRTYYGPETPPTKDGQYGVYIAACFGYSDQFGVSFTERRLWVFVTTDDQQQFLPQGSIQGHFERAVTSPP